MTSHPFLDFDCLYLDAPSLEPPSLDFIIKSVKWSALGLALVAAFGSLVLKLKKSKPLPSKHEESKSYSSDEEDRLPSSISSSEKAYPLRNPLAGGGGGEEEVFSVAGGVRGGMLRSRVRNPQLNFSPWSPNCEVVKVWGVDLRGGRGGWFGENGDYNGRSVVGVWDRRMRPDVAAIAKEWRPLMEEKKLLCGNSLFSDIDVWRWVDSSKAVVARLK